jgi:hypothetical protein
VADRGVVLLVLGVHPVAAESLAQVNHRGRAGWVEERVEQHHRAGISAGHAAQASPAGPTPDQIGLKANAAPSDARTMQCPTCGAPVEPGAYWCDRCATRLGTDARPRNPSSVPPAAHVEVHAAHHDANRVSWRTIGLACLTVVAALGALNLVHAATSPARDQPPSVAPPTTARPSRNALVFRAPDGSFEVRFPARPGAIVGGALPVGTGQPLAASSTVSARVGTRSYTVEWADITTADPQLNERMLERCNEPDGLTNLLVTARPITIAGQRGIECVLLDPFHAASAARAVAVFVTNGRLYSLQTAAPDGADPGTFSAFINSFRLT